MGGFRQSNSSRKVYYLGIDGNGNLYESSKEPKEGFSAHTNPMTGEPSGYRREYYNGLVGYLNYIGVKVIKNKQGANVQYFIMTFRDWDGDEDFCIMFPLTTQKNSIHRYVKSFVKYYANIDITRELVFNAFKKGKDDEYAPSNLIFAYPGAPGEKDQIVPMFFKNGQNNWPEPGKTKGFDGVERFDYRVQDQFVYDRLKEYIEDFNKRIPEVRAAIAASKGKSVSVQQPSNQQSPSTHQAQPQYAQQPVSQPQPQQQYQAPAQPPVYQAPVQQPAYQAPAPQPSYQAPVQQPVQQAPVATPPEFLAINDEDDLPF